MSDAWIPVVYALIGAISAGFASWIAARYAVKSVENKVDHVVRQNVVQEKAIDDTRKDMNGKLHDLIQSLITTALLKERAEVATRAVETGGIITKAEVAAEKLLALAEKVAKDKEG